jgi:EAL domain-containing protein (putative c-di-GMP-specific phosphodiesterase class I)
VTAEPSMTLAGKPVLEYQPAVDLATGRLLGMEALVRWEHPTKGRIAPDILIPWAEENGDIVALNAWVMEAACCEAELWSTGLQLAVNCSIIQLRRGEASKAITRALAASELNPDRLTIEVTERTINDDRAAADLRALSDLGVHLAVDDVGTSWSSLQVLRKFAIEIVKIDRAFINNLEAEEGMNRAIVEAIIHVGHSLAMSTVAEGVESAEQAAILREFGADVGQGYFFAPPLRSDEAHQLATAEPRPIFSVGPGRESSATAAAVQHPFTVIPGGHEPVANPVPAQASASPSYVAAPTPAAASAAASAAAQASVLSPGAPPAPVPAPGFTPVMAPNDLEGAGVLEPSMPGTITPGAPGSGGVGFPAEHATGFQAPAAPVPAPATFSPLTGENDLPPGEAGVSRTGRSGPLSLNLDIDVLGLNGSVTADAARQPGSEPQDERRQTPGEVA